jgi:two-component system, NtrC family, response regulator HydG
MELRSPPEGTLAEILVIDDEESIRYTFASFLSGEGHRVCTARSYAEGAAQISGKDFDLIFSDIILEGRTGIDILREARGKNLICPVVMITGYPTVETAAEAVRLGAFDYLQKPVEQETLLHITRLALEHGNVLGENERYRAHLDAVFRSVEDGILTVDRELRVLEMNDAAGRICGLVRGEIGRDLASSSMRCKEKFLSALKETVEGRKSVRRDRFECAQGAHAPKVLTFSTWPLVDRQGLFQGAVMVVRDETRLASLEQNLQERRRFHNLIGKSEGMQKLYSLIESLADVETTVLIAGESGTGKELVAEALHFMGGRHNRPLVKVNCSALSENLLESELFGHVKGAFTGAVNDRTGRFQKADGGSIFLDEIGDISPRVQASLLRVLQDKEFERVGDSKPIRVDVRVIAATNKDLREKVRRGEFREDLYYRLQVVELFLPPLRDRKEDIPLLIENCLKQLNEKFHKGIGAVSADVEKIFLSYPWPGNVRELKHALEHAFILCHADTITAEFLPLHLTASRKDGDVSREAGERMDAQTILRALEKTAWNKARAARLLGVDRKTLYRNIEKYNIPNHE